MGKFKRVAADTGLIYAAAIWGATFYMVKNAVEYINPIALVGYRFFIAAIILGLGLIIAKKRIFENFKSGIILGILLWFLYIPQTLGLKFTTAANSGFITGTFIMFVPLLVFLFHKKLPSFNKIFSILLVITGLWILTGGMSRLNMGDLLTLVCAVGYATHLFVSDIYMKRGLNPYVVTFQQFLVTGILSFITLLLTGGSFKAGNVQVINAILFLALFPSLSAFIIQLWAQKFTSPLKVSIIFSLEPVFGALFSWTLGNEEFIAIRALGGIIIVVAMIISEIPLPIIKIRANE